MLRVLRMEAQCISYGDGLSEVGEIQRLTPSMMPAVFRLRANAWATDGVRFPEEKNGQLTDPLDPDSEHYGYLDGDEPVAAIRISVHATNATMTFPDELRWSPGVSPLGYVARLAVHRNWRRLGLGHKLIDASIARLIELRVKGILAFTPILHISQYFETIGFTIYRTAPFALGDRIVPASAFYRAL
ncbi:MAG TPA: GNAT family N-acetyltransferase [Kofleriaceae bacterium]